MWEINLSDQATTFLLSLFLGVAFCLVFDLTRGLRLFGLNSKAAVFLTDIIYFLLVSFVNFCFFLTRESGQVRGYVFAGEIAGFFLFRLTLSKSVMAIIAFLYKAYAGVKSRMIKVKTKFYSKIKKKTLNLIKKVKKPIKKG